jgi:hypothetical protein
MKDNKPNIMFQSFSGEELRIPNYQENIVNGKDWVYYGHDNQYPNFLIELRDKSPIHSAILERKVSYTMGDGIQNPESFPMFKGNMDYELVKMFSDYFLMNSFAINVVWSRDGQSISHAEHVDISKIRYGKPNAFGKVEEYWYSNDWNDTRKAYNKPVSFPAYNPERRIGSQLFVWRGYSQGTNIYPKPEYISGIGWIVLDYTLQNFHVNNAQNSFSPSMSVILSGPVPENQEERDYIWREIKKQYGGSRGAGEIFLVFAPDGSESVKLEPISNNDNDERYLALAEMTRDMILTSQQVVSPMLFGVKTSGQLGGRAELLDAYELFLNTTIKPVQLMFSSIFEELFGSELEFRDSAPVAYRFGDNILQAILTQDEMREIVGYDPMTATEESITEEISDPTDAEVATRDLEETEQPQV